jgi:hypothetical protein
VVAGTAVAASVAAGAWVAAGAVAVAGVPQAESSREARISRLANEWYANFLLISQSPFDFISRICNRGRVLVFEFVRNTPPDFVKGRGVQVIS